MAKSYAQIHAQIQKLQAQADSLKAREMDQVVSRIRVAIEHYGLTADQLFGKVVRTDPTTKPRKGAARRSPATGRKAPIKYRDGDNTWSGRGNRPRWLVARLGEGRDLAEFKVG